MGGTCKSFTYNNKDSTCELYAVEPLDFAKSCNVGGGSVDVYPADCEQPADLCDLYTDGYCTYEGEYLDEVLTDIPDVGTCWSACAFKPNCAYYVHYALESTCNLYLRVLTTIVAISQEVQLVKIMKL